MSQLQNVFSLLTLQSGQRQNLHHRSAVTYTNIALAILCSSFLCWPAEAFDESSPSENAGAIWSTELPPDADSPLLNLMQTISGKHVGQKTTRLLNGVVEIHTTEKGVEFVRSDSQVLDWDTDTIAGDDFFHRWEETSQQAEKYLGPNASAFLLGLSSVKASNGVVEVHDSLHDCTLRFVDKGKAKFVRLEALRLKDIRLSIEREKGILWIKHLTGVEALLRVGNVKIPIQLREFSRRKTVDGQTVLTFGFIPSAFSPLRALLEPYRVSFTIRKRSEPKSEPKE